MKKLAVFFAMLAVGGAAAGEKIDQFFAAGKDAAKKTLSADMVYPLGKRFPFGFYSTGGGSLNRRGELLPAAEKDADQKAIFDAGATFIAPQYELNKEILETAEKYNVQCAYTIYGYIGDEPIHKKNLRTLHRRTPPVDWAAVKESVVKQVKTFANDKRIAYWNVTPEELRHWRVDEMKYLQTVSEAIHEADPMKRPVFMYEPGHRSGTALAKTFIYQDMGVKGTYTNYSGFKDKRVWVRYSIQAIADGIKLANRPHMVLCMLPEMFRQPEEQDLKLIPSWVRHDVYCAIANGAKAVMVFSGSKRPKFPAWQQYRDEYLKVCRELTGNSELGQAILFGKVMDDLSCEVIEGEKEQTIYDRGLKKDIALPTLSFRNLAYGNTRYLILVNSANTPVKAVVDDLPYSARMTVKNIFSDEPEMVVPEGNFEVDLAPLGVAVFKVFAK